MKITYKNFMGETPKGKQKRYLYINDIKVCTIVGIMYEQKELDHIYLFWNEMEREWQISKTYERFGYISEAKECIKEWMKGHQDQDNLNIINEQVIFVRSIDDFKVVKGNFYIIE